MLSVSDNMYLVDMKDVGAMMWGGRAIASATNTKIKLGCHWAAGNCEAVKTIGYVEQNNYSDKTVKFVVIFIRISVDLLRQKEL